MRVIPENLAISRQPAAMPPKVLSQVPTPTRDRTPARPQHSSRISGMSGSWSRVSLKAVYAMKTETAIRKMSTKRVQASPGVTRDEKRLDNVAIGPSGKSPRDQWTRAICRRGTEAAAIAPIRRKEAPIRRKEAPIRRKEAPIRRKEAPIRRKNTDPA